MQASQKAFAQNQFGFDFTFIQTMFRRFSRIPSQRRLAGLFGLTAATGIYHLSNNPRTIHADSDNINDPEKIEIGTIKVAYPIQKDMGLLEKLRDTASTYVAPTLTGLGVLRVDALSLPCDGLSHSYIDGRIGEDHNADASVVVNAIYTGYDDPMTADFLLRNLANFILHFVSSIPSRLPSSELDHQEVGAENIAVVAAEEVIPVGTTGAFKIVDQLLVANLAEHVLEEMAGGHIEKDQASALLTCGYGRSSALVSIFDCKTRMLHVALAGRGRAVVGRRSGKSSYQVTQLTTDQDESSLPIRVLGGGGLKWPLKMQERLHADFLGDPPQEPSKDVTPEPVISDFQAAPGDFLILGSNAFWDCLSNEEAVGLVGIWAEKRDSGLPRDLFPVATSPNDIWKPDQLPVTIKDRKDNTPWNTPKRFINTEKNVAYHLIRNALGGEDEVMTRALLFMSPFRKQKFKGDIAVSVIFFQ
ncbi:hypothetical protein BDQ12DRAFT_725994 [Crucibulum laeve]|uniref:PPM-type phosphatase domain-containing protein n=1 Tax=Crucibulum laeve TaxID=68775 RepID=A0A5C3LTP7_9AGAR|nr:hypothetical protein BDQ12DRAFT_725994 [Crucibulum laeve]